MKRRAVLAGVPAALFMGGCSQLLSDDEVTFEADTATVSDGAQSDTGYSEVAVQEETIERNFEQVDRTVVVVNVLAEYSREVSIGPIGGELSRFTVMSTPTVEVGPVGPLNPVDDMDNDELAEMVQEEYDSVENVQEESEREATLLGSSVTVTKYSAEATTQGESVDVYIHLCQTQDGEDFVISIGVHPQDIDEQENIDQLIGAVTHPSSA